jgi:hypothetical protein
MVRRQAVSYFQITVEVAGLKFPVDNGVLAGFYTNRIARGVDDQEAFEHAKTRLLAESKVAHLIEVSRKNGAGEPQVAMTDAHEISFWTYLFTRNRQGLALYPEDESNDEPER